MGMTEAVFYETTPRFFFNAMRAYSRKQEMEAERESHWKRYELNLQRAGYIWGINLQVEQMHRMTAEDWFPLPWDEKPVPKEPGDLKKEAGDFIKSKGYDQGIPVDEFFN